MLRIEERDSQQRVNEGSSCRRQCLDHHNFFGLVRASNFDSPLRYSFPGGIRPALKALTCSYAKGGFHRCVAC